MISNILKIKKSRITQNIIKKLTNDNDNDNNIFIKSVGLTTFYLFTEKKILIIKHSGNMGNSIERSVDPNVERLLKLNIKNLKNIYKYNESGSPDYYYNIEFKLNY